MPHDARALLEDMRRAAQLIQNFTAGKSLADYSADLLLRAGVEREFIVIGEALSRLEKLAPNIAGQITNYRQIVGFRNVLVHGYDAIEDAIVWRVIEHDLPILRQQVQEIFEGLDSGGTTVAGK